MLHLFQRLWIHDEGQDVAEYAIMLAIILVMTVGLVQLDWCKYKPDL